MPQPISIRRLAAADLAEYKALRDALLEAHPEAFTSDADAERARTAESYLARLGLERPAGAEFTLGAWQQRELIGAITCERDRRIKVAHIGHIVGMMVREDRHGLGVGRALLDECIGQARRAAGITMLTLSVTAGNAAAVGLYLRAGFVRYGTLPNAICVGERYHAKDLMALML